MKFTDPFESFSETYTPIEPAISGGTGYVYKVLDSEGKPFALKMLKPEQIHKDRVKRFQQEIHFCQRFKHKNILSVVDSGFKDVKGTKCPFYVMAYYEHSLRDIISETHNSDQIIHIFSEILDGVEAIHLKDSWHRDLKPENILLNANLNDIVIADFGIAHFSEELLHTIIDTKPREKLLNISYSAPEQRNRSSNVDHRSDIFALGKILNEMFTKVVPEGTDFKKIETVDSNLSYLDDIVWKMIQNNPDSRYSSIEKIKYDLIGRKNEFINFQKVHSLEKTVIPSNFLDERLINNPVKLVDIEPDTLNEQLKFILNQEVDDALWTKIFNTVLSNGKATDMGLGFTWMTGQKLFRPMKRDLNVSKVVEDFKIMLNRINDDYRKEVERRNTERRNAFIEKIKKEKKAEEENLKIRRSIKIH